jgi:hypothetical protein
MRRNATAIFLLLAPPHLVFTPVSEKRSAIQFVLRNSATAEKHQIETMPGGVALFDYDNDGRLDIYFTNGARQPQLQKVDGEYYNRLYRNCGDWKFQDVTEKAGVRGAGYNMGVAAADYDNDGFTDLFVAGLERNILYRNLGDGAFEDVTARSGLLNPNRVKNHWSIAAGWFDYDNDGRLDLFVVNYVVWDPATEPACGDGSGKVRTYCHPRFYQGLPNLLYHNEGGGRFRDVSEPSGIAKHIGKGMGLSFADYDGDGGLDVFVANDTVRDFLFRNEGNGRFEEVGLQAGVAYNDDGRALSSMGTDFRDIDNDGRPDLFVTALSNETHPLYRNLGKGLFADVTYPSLVGRATIALSGWSSGIFDFNNDGWKDLFCANGDVNDNTELFSSRKSRQPLLLMLNDGKGTFSAAGYAPEGLYRGAAFGDLDNDGRIDVVATRLNDRAVLLRNTAGGANHWLTLRLEGTRSNRSAIGARVKIVSSSEREQWNHASTSVGYASSSQPAVHFGLGTDSGVKRVEIRWPSGTVQQLADLPVDRYLTVREP